MRLQEKAIIETFGDMIGATNLMECFLLLFHFLPHSATFCQASVSSDHCRHCGIASTGNCSVTTLLLFFIRHLYRYVAVYSQEFMTVDCLMLL